MATSSLVFDAFCQEFFNDPYEFYRWMRAEAPVYYKEAFVARAKELAAKYGDRFLPPDSLTS
jgi:hypothetical protein